MSTSKIADSFSRHITGIDGFLVGSFIPVRLRAVVATLCLQKDFVHAYKKSVPGQEVADVVDDVGLCYVNVEELIVARCGVCDAACWCGGLETKLSVNVGLLLGVCESVPGRLC